MNHKRTWTGVVVVAGAALLAAILVQQRTSRLAAGGDRSVAAPPAATASTRQKDAQGRVIPVVLNGTLSAPTTSDDLRAAEVERMHRARLVQKQLERLKAPSSAGGVELPAAAVEKAIRETQAKLDELEEAQK